MTDTATTIRIDLREEDKRRVEQAAARLGVDSTGFVRKAVADELVLSTAVSNGAEVLLKYPDGSWRKVSVR